MKSGSAGEVLGLDRSIGSQNGAITGPYAEFDGPKVDTRPPEDFDHLRLQNDAAAAAVEIMRRALEYVDIPTDSSQQIAGKKPAQRPAHDQGPLLLWAVLRGHGSVSVWTFDQAVGCGSRWPAASTIARRSTSARCAPITAVLPAMSKCGTPWTARSR